jgi:hypothetical protein
MLIQGQEFPDIWCGIEYLTSLVLEKSPISDFSDLRAIIEQLQASISSLQPLAVAVAELIVVNHGWLIWKPRRSQKTTTPLLASLGEGERDRTRPTTTATRINGCRGG